MLEKFGPMLLRKLADLNSLLFAADIHGPRHASYHLTTPPEPNGRRKLLTIEARVMCEMEKTPF